MSGYQEHVGGRLSTAATDDIDAIESPVTVTTSRHIVTFGGNGFDAKHLRRLRQNSIKELASGKANVAADKLNKLLKEGAGRADARFRQSGDPVRARNTTVFLDLAGFCQLGGKISIAINKKGWVPYGNHQQQQEVDVVLDRALVTSGNGLGQPDAASSGFGARLTVTVMKGTDDQIEVVHLVQAVVATPFAHQDGVREGKPIVLALKQAKEFGQKLAKG